MEVSSFSLFCPSCHREYDLRALYWRCPSCPSPLEVSIEYPKVKDFSSLIDRGEISLWRYKSLIPFSEARISLGEGLTPLIPHREGDAELYFKLEYVSPTGSFKDRGATVGVSRAKSVGVEKIVEDSSGNAGLAYSVYSAFARMKAKVYVPQDAPIAKRELMKRCGTEVIECRTREEAAQRAILELGEKELYIGHTWDPFFLEGTKTVAYELYEYGVVNFDSVVVPVSAGTLLLGFYKGFKDLMEMGLMDRPPRLYAVQAGGITPIYEELYGRKWEGEEGSLADGLRVKDPPRRKMIVNAIKEFDGDVVVIGNSEIVESMKQLYRMGLTVEPTSAIAYAAYRKLGKEAGLRVLIPLTGTGMKTLDKLVHV